MNRGDQMHSVRLVEFDLLRIISTVAVIIIHVTSMNVPASDGVIYINQFARFAVPFFFMLSGYLMSHISRKMTAVEYYKYRLPKLFIPYLTWTIIYVLYWFFEGNTPINDLPMAFLRDILLGTCFVHFYFYYALMQLYLMFPLLIRWLEKSPWSILCVTLALTAASQTIIFLHLLGVIALPPIYVGYSRFFPLWIFFFVMGMLLAQNDEKFSAQIKNLSAGLLTTGYLITFLLLVLDFLVTGVYDTSIKPSVITYSLMSFVFFYAMAGKMRKTLIIHRRSLSYLSQHSLFVLLIHPMIVSVLEKYFPKPQLIGMHPDWYFALMFFIVTASSYLISALVGKWFYAPLLGGAYSKKIKSIVKRHA